MKQIIILLQACIAILIVMVTESNAAKNGCTWSGCAHFTGAVCATGVTGGSGRPIRHRDEKCQWTGRRDFCCDSDCRHQECGLTCDYLGMKSYSEVDPIPCTVTGIPRYPPIPSSKYFCCP